MSATILLPAPAGTLGWRCGCGRTILSSGGAVQRCCGITFHFPEHAILSTPTSVTCPVCMGPMVQERGGFTWYCRDCGRSMGALEFEAQLKKPPTAAEIATPDPGPLEQAAAQLMGEYVSLCDEIDELTERKEELRDQLIAAVDFNGAAVGAKVDFPGLGSVRLSPGRTSRTIERSRLIVAGFDPKTIDECTRVTVGKPYVRITRESEDPTGEE